MVDNDLNDVFHSNIFPTLFLLSISHQIVRLPLAAVSTNGLTLSCQALTKCNKYSLEELIKSLGEGSEVMSQSCRFPLNTTGRL